MKSRSPTIRLSLVSDVSSYGTLLGEAGVPLRPLCLKGKVSFRKVSCKDCGQGL